MVEVCALCEVRGCELCAWEPLCACELVCACEFELGAREFELVAREFEFVPREFELVPREFELEPRVALECVERFFFNLDLCLSFLRCLFALLMALYNIVRYSSIVYLSKRYHNTIQYGHS